MSNRRQTLGALSPSQLNSRAGNAASRVATGKDAVQSTGANLKPGRKSLAPDKAAQLLLANGATMGGSSIGAGPMGGGTAMGAPSMNASADPRRSSAYGNLGKQIMGPRADPRPLSDKGFQANCARTIIEYLSTHGYPAPIAPKTLLSPTAKDFANVALFLQQQFDPNIKAFTKIEDDVPAFFKRLNYPFQISKSALFAVGAPHSWPAVLAALTWLVELLNYNEKIEQLGQDNAPGVLEDPDSATKRKFFEYICLSYRYFLSGDDDRCHAVDQEMLSQFDVKEKMIKDAYARIQQSNEAVKAEVHQLSSEPSPLEQANQRLAEKSEDTKKFMTLIENLQGMKASLERKIAERQEEVSGRQEQLVAVTRENDQLRARIAAQPLNKADVARMVQERHKQKEILDSVTLNCDNLQDRLDEQQREMNRILQALEASVTRHNQVAHRLKLIPASTKRAGGVTYELRINREATTAAEFANVDLKGVIKPGLERLCEVYRSKAAQLGRDLLGLRESAGSVAEALREKTEENRALEAQIDQLEAKLQTRREAYDEQLKSMASQAEVLQQDTVNLRNDTTARASTVDSRKAGIIAEYEALQRNNDAEIARLRVELRSACEVLLQHRMHVQQVLANAATAVKEAFHDVQQVPLPSISA